MKNICIAIALTSLLACGSREEVKTDEPEKSATPAVSSFESLSEQTIELTGTPVNIAGITFRAPSGWQELGPSGMRAASYYYPAVGGDKDSATVVAFFFGPQQGGSVEQNMARWVGQMQADSNTSQTTSAVYDTIEVNGLRVFTVEVNGTYAPSPMGQPSGTDVSPRPGYSLVAAIVESPEGSVFFRLTGPVKTASEMTRGMVAMVRGITKISG